MHLKYMGDDFDGEKLQVKGLQSFRRMVGPKDLLVDKMLGMLRQPMTQRAQTLNHLDYHLRKVNLSY